VKDTPSERRPVRSSRDTISTAGDPPGVCVGLLTGGKPVRLYGTSPAEFIPTLTKTSIAWVNFAVSDLRTDGERIATLLGFGGSLVETLLASGNLSEYEDRDSELGLLLPVARVAELEVSVHPLIVLVREGLVLTLHEEKKVNRMARMARYADTFLRKIPANLNPQDTVTIVLTRILNENNDRNFDGLRSIEEHGVRISGALLEKKGPNREEVGRQIYEMKHALIAYLDTLWASLDVIQNLRHGDAEMVSDDETLLARVALLADNVQRHIQLTEHMSDVLASGLEVLQSIYNNQLQSLNNRMAYVTAFLTILGTAVLVPNTIATVLAAGAFELTPADRGWYIGLIAGSTIVATSASYWYVKRSGMLPRPNE